MTTLKIVVRGCGSAFTDAGPLGKCPLVYFAEHERAVATFCGATRKPVDTDADAGRPRWCPVSDGLTLEMERE